jgi:hypothetical protein
MARHFVSTLFLAVAVAFGSTAQAQAPAAAPASAQVPEHRWSVDFGIGFDNGISGNINSSATGILNGQNVVILKNKYEDVYGTGLHIRFGGGYMLTEESEVKLTFTFQSLDADLTRLGDIGFSNLYGQYDDYQSLSMDVGYRRYMRINPTVRGYGEATIGIGFIDETDVELIAPQANLSGNATDFYDRTAAFTFGINAGALFAVHRQTDLFAQLGLRYVSGMAKVDQFVGTGLETINDSSARWALPFSVGIRFQF